MRTKLVPVLVLLLLILGANQPAFADPPGHVYTEEDAHDLWVWFRGQVRRACLTPPEIELHSRGWMEDRGLPSQGSYWAAGRGYIYLAVGQPWYVMVHELAHHYDYRCGWGDRHVGRSFARAAGFQLRGLVWYDWGVPHDERAAEQFAQTLMWVLTGVRDKPQEIVEEAAWTLLPLVKRPVVIIPSPIFGY